MAHRRRNNTNWIWWLLAFFALLLLVIVMQAGNKSDHNEIDVNNLKTGICYQLLETGPATVTGVPCENWPVNEKETWLLNPGPDETLQYSSCRNIALPKEHTLQIGTYFMLDARCRGKIADNILTLY